MNDSKGGNEGRRSAWQADRLLRRHMYLFLGINGALWLIDRLTPGTQWFYWPLAIWGVGLAAHYLFVKSMSIDESWAEERTAQLRQKSYDLGHIEAIEKAYNDADANAARRSKKPRRR